MNVSVVLLIAICLTHVALTATADELCFYSETQADRGAQLYIVHCEACHGAALEGASAVALKGEGFLSRWSHPSHTLDDLLYIIRTQMPSGEPGKLTRAQYLDITAYLMKMNDYPPGNEDLPLDPRLLSMRLLRR